MVAKDRELTVYLTRFLVSNGADIYFEDSDGCTPLSLVTDLALRADMLFLTPRPLLLFLVAVSIAEDLNISRSLRRVAQNPDLVREIVKIM